MQTPLAWLGALVAVAGALVGACGSSGSSSNGGTATTACTSASECNPQQCLCTDGNTVDGPSVCLQGACFDEDMTSLCATGCDKHGGVSAIRPTPNVASSPECDAWCAKGASLGCGSTTCDRFFFCRVKDHGCEAAERAALKCAVDTGTWECGTQGGSWSVSSHCADFSELCAGEDAGTD